MITNKINSWMPENLTLQLKQSRQISNMFHKYGLVIGIVIGIICIIFNKFIIHNKIKLFLETQPLRNWNFIDKRNDSLKLSNLNYYKESHISIDNEKKHIYDLRLTNKQSENFCPAKVYNWIKYYKHYSNCLQCKTCLQKSIGKTINWNVAKKWISTKF